MITAAHREALDRAGYVVVADALDSAWLTELKRAFENAPVQSNGTQHVRLEPEMAGYHAWLRLKEHPIAVAAAKHVLLAPFQVHDVHGRNPLPGFGQQGLHADWPERDAGSPYFVLTALWMIDDFTEKNGATRVVPGSHLLPRALPKSYAQPTARHPEEMIVTGKAGSVLVFNGHLWHAGRKNESQGPRRAGQMVVWREGVRGLAME